MNPQRINAILSGEDRSVGASLVRAGCAVAEPFYRAGVAARNAMFDRGWRGPVDLGRPTISVGNITTGGTGKTPMVIEIVNRLRAMGARPAVLMRGYAMADGPSDEARVIQNECEGKVRVEANSNRAGAARRALSEDAGITHFVLDDGFQHRQVKRDLDLVLIDATHPWGHGRALPRGLLREPKANLHRATATVLTNCTTPGAMDLAALGEQVAVLTGKPPVARVEASWKAWRDHADREFNLSDTRDARVAAVCGIGNPRPFLSTLKSFAGNLVHVRQFPDHHAYMAADLEQIIISAKAGGAEAIVTTEKDWVKWRTILKGVPPLPVYRPIVKIRFLEGGDALEILLAQATHQAI